MVNHISLVRRAASHGPALKAAFGCSLLLWAGLFTWLLQAQLPADIGFFALFAATDNLDLLLVQSYTLPRVVMASTAGGILGFAAVLLQQVMKNPLASDNTLGISSGAQFALFLCAIFVPQQLEKGASMIALIGAGVSLLLVLTLAVRKTMSPLLLILAGLVVNLYFGSFSALMMLFYPEESRGLMQWGAGSLAQESWRDSLWLFGQAFPAIALIGLLLRPLSMLSLDDAGAQGLGVPVTKLRVIGVSIAAFLIAAVVSKVGMLGFVGLASATLVRQLGVRSFKGQLLGALIAGALLLGITDLCLQLLAHNEGISLPSGAVTALLGTPLLLWLMFRSLPHTGRVQETDLLKIRRFRPLVSVSILCGLTAALVMAFLLGKSAYGWSFNFTEELLALRAPRVLSASAAGILLATAGVILQRLTLNPMAGPELLGVSSGASMGILAVVFLFSVRQIELFWIAGILGAGVTLSALNAVNRKNGMLPEKVLLTGISLSALFDACYRIALASGDSRVNQLVSWTSGSTQGVSGDFALAFFALSLVLLGVSLIFSRWLELLALQTPMAQALGLNLTRTRRILILFGALLTASATLIVGPLSFIGLLVPQITRFLGVRKAHNQLWFSACLGGMMMTLADWIGRQILFPYEVPAGLVATLVGGTYFLLMVRRV